MMPRTTVNQAFPYPVLDSGVVEAADPVAVQNLASAIDTKLSALDVRRRAALRRPIAKLTRDSSPQSVAANTFVNVTFDSYDWPDTPSFTNLATTPNQYTIPANAGGVYQIHINIDFLLLPGTASFVDAYVLKNATVVAGKRLRWMAPNVQLRWLEVLVPTDVITFQTYWANSVGANTNMYFDTFIRKLADA